MLAAHQRINAERDLNHLYNFYAAGAALLSKEGAKVMKKREAELRKLLTRGES